MKLFNKKLNKKLVFSSLLLLVLISASSFRLTHMDLIEFKGDEAVNLYLAARPFLGYGFAPGSTVSSFEILNPPLINYLLYPFVAISFNPQVVSFFIALLNVISILLFFVIIKKYYGLLTATISSLLLSFSPWAILYSRKIWAQDFLIFFSVILFFCVHKVLVDKDNRYQLLYIITSLFLIQLHQASIFFILLLSIFLIIQKIRVNIKYVIIGSLLGLLPLLPFFSYELHNSCPDCTALFSASQRTSSSYSPEIFFLPFQIIGKGEFNHIIGSDMVTFAEEHTIIYATQKIFYFLYILLLVGIVITYKKYRYLKSFILATMLLPLIYFLLKIPPFIHYFVIILPFLLLYVGNAFVFGITQKNKFIKLFSCVLFGVILTCTIGFNVAFYSFLEKHGEFAGDYGSIFKKEEDDVQSKLSNYQNLPEYNELVLFSYIPHTQFYGGTPIPTMIFDNSVTKDNVTVLEKKAIEKKYDIRLYYQLLSYYTKPPITQENIIYLRSKQATDSLYKKLYEESYMIYLHNHLKKSYISNLYHFLLEFPEHWQQHEDKELQLEDDEMIIDIYSQESKKTNVHDNGEIVHLGNQYVTRFICQKNSVWCGTSFENVIINNKPYGIDVFPKEIKINYSSNTYNAIEKDLGDVIKSIQIP